MEIESDWELIETIGGSGSGSGSSKKRGDTPTANETNYNDKSDKKIIRSVLGKNDKDYYDIMGMSFDASDRDIKMAYRQLALKLHPDKCKSDNAEKAFKKMKNAFEYLSIKRKRYDESKPSNDKSKPSNIKYSYPLDIVTDEVGNIAVLYNSYISSDWKIKVFNHTYTEICTISTETNSELKDLTQINSIAWCNDRLLLLAICNGECEVIVLKI